MFQTQKGTFQSRTKVSFYFIPSNPLILFRNVDLQNQIAKLSSETQGGEEEVSLSLQLTSLQSENINLKAQLEKLIKEKEDMLLLMQDGQNSNVFDAFKFKNIIDENKDLLRQIEDLKFDLANEKDFN